MVKKFITYFFYHIIFIKYLAIILLIISMLLFYLFQLDLQSIFREEKNNSKRSQKSRP